jgi:hypothetical protein
VVLKSGHWLLVYNDTTRGRDSLAASLSDDEGRTWKWTRHLERQKGGSYHYPAAIAGRDGTIHVVYSYFVQGGKSMKHAAFNEAWIALGDTKIGDRLGASTHAEGSAAPAGLVCLKTICPIVLLL